MEEKVKLAIEEYQCPGCIAGYDVTCFKPNENGGVGCGGHMAGTMMMGIGSFYLGMPKGFNRVGEFSNMIPTIYEKFEDNPREVNYDKFNIPVWKHLNKDGHTFVRGIMPRINKPFLHIYLENCIGLVDCFNVTEKDIEEMD